MENPLTTTDGHRFADGFRKVVGLAPLGKSQYCGEHHFNIQAI
jgi:hypothetical protein